MQFLQENWIALTSLVVALTGGVPGILAAIQHFRRQARFRFTVAGFMGGEIVDQVANVTAAMIVLSGAIANEGDRPLSPSAFRLWVRLRRRWVEFASRPIPPDVTFPSENQDIRFENAASKDLLKVPATIEPGDAAHGHLMFLRDGIDPMEIRRSRPLRMKLQCHDAFGRIHKVRLKLPLDTSGEIVHPRLGISAAPKRRRS